MKMFNLVKKEEDFARTFFIKQFNSKSNSTFRTLRVHPLHSNKTKVIIESVLRPCFDSDSYERTKIHLLDTETMNNFKKDRSKRPVFQTQG